MNAAQAVTAITDAVMGSVPTVVVDEREFVSVSKVKDAAKRWTDRFFDELGDALEKAAVEIEGKTETEIRTIMVEILYGTLARHVKVTSNTTNKEMRS